MYRIHHWFYNLLGFSRSQTNGFLIFLPILTLILFSEPIVRHWKIRHPPDFTSDKLLLDSMVMVYVTQLADTNRNSVSEKLVQLMPFNPNSATITELETLGFSPRLATTILNYRTKGGVFRLKKDLLRIHGMDSSFYNTIFAYIQLPEFHPRNQVEKRKQEKKQKQRFDLNLADTSELKKIYGIGDKLSLRILKYRDALGGFISMMQLREVYKLDTAVIQRLEESSFIAKDFQPVRLNINTVDRQKLAFHPYLPRQVADAIVAYRFSHGNYSSIEDLRKVKALDSAAYRKILPYLKVED